MVSTTTIRIAIADDHEIFRDGLKRLLDTEPAFEVVGEASDGMSAIQLTREIRPDVLLLDVAMPRMGGLETLAGLASEDVRIVLLTAEIGPAELLRAVQLGARGVVLKESATKVLIEGIHRVVAGQYLIGGGVEEDQANAIKKAGTPPARRYNLTARELEIVKAIVGGDNNRDIADRLAISLQTVKHHLTSIFNKTGAASRLELALLAIRQGIVQPD